MPSHRTTHRGGLRRWCDGLFEPVDIASLVYFRVVFGILMVIELWRYVLDGSAHALWIRPDFHFRYPGFEWIPHPAGYGIYLLMAAAGVGAAGMVLGFFYRFSAVLFTVCFAWLSLLDQAKYMNHFYLICLLGTASIFLPAHRQWSVDIQRHPGQESNVAPRWTLALIQGLMVLVYFYGGVAKINSDWLQGEPVRMWLEARAQSDRWGAWLHSDGAVYFICYGGLLFDLGIGPLLLWKKTRTVAALLCVGFHLANSQLFSIGVFPWLGIAMIGVFFEPSWPRRAFSQWLQPSPRQKTTPLHDASPPTNRPGTSWEWTSRRAIGTALAAFFLVQMLLPLRHWLYPGDVHWTEEGHMFAWHMMLRSKQGEAHFWVKDTAQNQAWEMNPLKVLSLRQYVKMVGRPEMLRAFAREVHRQEIERLSRIEERPLPARRLSVHVVAHVQLNRDGPALLVDPNVDMSQVHWNWGRSTWILPRGNRVRVPDWIPRAGGWSHEGLRNEAMPME